MCLCIILCFSSYFLHKFNTKLKFCSFYVLKINSVIVILVSIMLSICLFLAQSEHPVPEQFKTVLNKAKSGITTTPVESTG